jgi:hypothetical protein
VSLISQASGVPEAPAGLHVTYDGTVYPAEELARGAAYELYSADPVTGFDRDPRPGSHHPWHRFVHATEVESVRGGRSDGGPADVPAGAPPADFRAGELDSPLMAPLSRTRTWADIQQLSQSPAGREDPILDAVLGSAVIRRGTRMVKILSARQLSGYLRGWLPFGFCYREYDVAHLRTPTDLSLLRTDLDDGGGTDIAYALRWRAIDPSDYAVPAGANFSELTRIPPHDRVGPPVLGTGFTPSGRHLIPEFVTRDFADLPLPANAALLAYTPEGDEVVLYTYQPEQRGWLRLAGPQWRHLLAPLRNISPDQEYIPTGEAPKSTHLVGDYGGQTYEAVADLPGDFRVLAMTRAARYPVDAVHRRARYVNWRGTDCLVLREESAWLRLRLCRPDPDNIATLGAQCYERGIYETWAPVNDVDGDRIVDLPYPL